MTTKTHALLSALFLSANAPECIGLPAGQDACNILTDIRDSLRVNGHRQDVRSVVGVLNPHRPNVVDCQLINMTGRTIAWFKLACIGQHKSVLCECAGRLEEQDMRIIEACVA